MRSHHLNTCSFLLYFFNSTSTPSLLQAIPLDCPSSPDVRCISGLASLFSSSGRNSSASLEMYKHINYEIIVHVEEEMNWPYPYPGLHGQRYGWGRLVQDRGLGTLDHQPEDNDGQQGQGHCRLPEEVAQLVRHGLHYNRAWWSDFNIERVDNKLPAKTVPRYELIFFSCKAGRLILCSPIKNN